MKGRGLSNSPNWYTSHACDSIENGLFCFAAKNFIYFLDASDAKNVQYLRSLKFPARISSLSFSPSSSFSHGDKLLDHVELAIGTENGKVTLWKDSIKLEHSPQFSTLKENKITCVTWIENEGQDVFSSDDKGVITHYSVSTMTTKQCQFIRSGILSLRCSPIAFGSLLAAGYQGGSILVIDFAQRNGPVIAYRLKGHNDDVHTLQWCPKYRESNNEFLLASGSKDKTIRVWDVQTERCKYSYIYPHHTGGNQQKSNDGGRVKFWASLHWSKYDCSKIIIGDTLGDVMLWDYTKLSSDGRCILTILKSSSAHSRPIFTICSTTDMNKRSILITTSLDRLINVWDVEEKSSVCSIPTVGGFIYCIDFSSSNGGRIAIGCGDQQLRVWNLNSSLNTYKISTFWQGIQSKIMCIKWHPIKEGIISFGTDEGRIGIYNVLSQKMPMISSTYHKGTVYNVTWGPRCTKDIINSEKEFVLFSCGDNKIIQHDPSNLACKAIDIDTFICDLKNEKIQRTEFAWKCDWTAVAIGNNDGSIEIRKAGSLQLLTHIFVHKKLIQCLAWHPKISQLDSSNINFDNWLATSSNENDIHIFDLSSTFDSEEEEVKVICSSDRQLSSHTLRVPWLSWNPHSRGKLVSASYDCTVQVWDAIKGEPQSNFCGHHDRVFCAVWNPLDADEIFSGSEDHTLQNWKISQQDQTMPSNRNLTFLKNNKKKKKNKNKDNRSGQLVCNKTSDRSESVSVASSQNDCQLNADECGNKDKLMVIDDVRFTEERACQEIASQIDPLPLDDDVNSENLVLVKKKKKLSSKHILPLTSGHDNRSEGEAEDSLLLLSSLYDYSYPSGSDNKNSNNHLLGTFHKGLEFFITLEDEIRGHEADENVDLKLQLEIWKGNIGGALVYAKNKGKLNDWLVSIAASGSQSLHQEMCCAYGEQLDAEGNVRKAACYFLACHQVFKAIDVLKKALLFREAVFLAKTRLPHDSTVVKQLMLSWAEYCHKNGHFELAAKCLLCANEPIEAAKILSKRSDENSLRIAAHIVTSCQNNDLKFVYVRQSIENSLLNNNWEMALRICTELSQEDEIFVKTHEWLIESYKQEEWPSKGLYERHWKQWSNRQDSQYKSTIFKSLQKFTDNSDPMSLEKLMLRIALKMVESWLATDERKKRLSIIHCLDHCFKFKNFKLMKFITHLYDDERKLQPNLNEANVSPEERSFYSYNIISRLSCASAPLSCSEIEHLCPLIDMAFSEDFSLIANARMKLYNAEQLGASKMQLDGNDKLDELTPEFQSLNDTFNKYQDKLDKDLKFPDPYDWLDVCAEKLIQWTLDEKLNFKVVYGALQNLLKWLNKFSITAEHLNLIQLLDSHVNVHKLNTNL